MFAGGLRQGPRRDDCGGRLEQ